ncbi:MAG: transcription-repair coupling factor, partial [Gemmatimonadota bacterium]
ATLHEETGSRVVVAVAEDSGQAAAIEADLDALLGEGVAHGYPQREALPYESGEPHIRVAGLRVEAVEALFSGRTRLLVTTLRALQERAAVPERLARLRLTIRVGDEPGFGETIRTLEARGFQRTGLVEEVGQFAVRGGLLDVFSFGTTDPVRVEFWGDEITSIRLFDILDQRSTRDVAEVHLLPMDFPAEEDTSDGGLAAEPGPLVSRSLLDLLPEEALIVSMEGERAAGTPAAVDPAEGARRIERDVAHTWEQVQQAYLERKEEGRDPRPPEELFLTPNEMRDRLRAHARITLREPQGGEIDLGAEPAPIIERNIPLLVQLLREGAGMGHRTLILCDNDGQVHRLEEILRDSGGVPPGTSLAIGSVDRGFVLPHAIPPLRVYTDHEIFRRGRRLRRGRRFHGAVALESLAQLTPGDYVVHMDHGIGKFRGLERIRVGGEELEALAVEYAGGEVLRLPVYRLDLIERWVGETDEMEPPQVHRIGGKRWKTLRKKTEEAIEKMAAELLQLYAERETAGGYTFSPDTRWQKEMESSFLFEDTPDQRKATVDVKRDMEASLPMDRLVCGDVGYGKTEVAIRAAFKAVQDGKQVAVLAPTTILVEQHRHTFEERLADYPVRIGGLSRFRTPKEQKEILLGVEKGEVDIVIGTHRLLSPDVHFADLGLLIIDEEQRFGVKHKERLKSLRTSIDVLTLTATPIPRTLQLSMAGLRSLSLIQTPPRDRLPIITQLIPWSDRILLEAMGRELDRGGQVFFLHNRVETIHTLAERVRKLAPEASVVVAHGQMSAHDLDEAMRSFVDGEVDILVCSSIIENGLDVPNANTLIVDHADHFGLAQLYQIRGRVGRSDRRAYCYLVVPDHMNEDAERRLKVLEHFTELGSGYAVALRDLELRGAGNLLGANQSGFAHAVGMDTYLRLLQNTVRRLREGGEPDDTPRGDPDISLAGSAFLPDEYITDSGQKLHLYRRLSKFSRQDEVDDLRREMRDRYGPPPPEVERLLDAHTLRLLGRELGIERIFIREREGRVTFRPEVVPRMTDFDRPFRDRQVEVEIGRMAPLSLRLRQVGPEPLTSTLIRALSILIEDRAKAA